MPIIHMVSKPENAPTGAVNLRDVGASYQTTNVWIYETHHGLCLSEREYNGRDDSDFYMTVWNPETKQPESIQFATTRGWSYPCLGSRVDATPEVVAEWRQYQENQRVQAEKTYKERLAKMPTVHKTVKVVAGRKIPVGTEGRVFWSNVKFKTDKVLGILFLGYQGRVGIETAQGLRVFVDVEKIEVI